MIWWRRARRSGGLRWGKLSPLLMVSLVAVWALVGCGGSGESAEREALREYRRGTGLQEQGKLLEADKAYWEAIQLNPRLAEAYAGRGHILYLFEDYRPAMSHLNAAVKLDPDLASAYNYRGLVYVAAEEFDTALLNFTRAIQLDPALSEAYYSRAKVYYKNDDIVGAIDDMNTLIELEPGVPKFYMDRAILWVSAGESGRAEGDLEQVLALTQDDELVLAAKKLLSDVRRRASP